ncbi:glycosyltransferase family 2 protein [Patescibacteria group bacterium]|nr:glycosyltransferase family 2 protein [Patescibacteria group bacterium]
MKQQSLKKISVLIPVFNEDNTVLETIRRVREVEVPGFEKEIIVIDDGSTDATREKLRAVSGIRLIMHGTNQGKGAAVKSGLAVVAGDIVLIQDADLELDPVHFPDLLRSLCDGQAQVVFGSRFINVPNELRGWHYHGNKLLTAITNAVLGTDLTDEATCYKVMKTETMKELDLQSNGFDVDIEITAKLAKKGYQIDEIPVSYNRRTRKEGKKIRLFYDGAKTLLKLVRFYYWD